MSTAIWMDLYGHSGLRVYFLDMARAFTRDLGLREDLYQEAWLAVGECAGGKCESYYKAQGFRAMDRYRKRFANQMERGNRRRARERINRVGKKYLLKTRPKPPSYPPI